MKRFCASRGITPLGCNARLAVLVPFRWRECAAQAAGSTAAVRRRELRGGARQQSGLNNCGEGGPVAVLVRISRAREVRRTSCWLNNCGEAARANTKSLKG